MLKQEITQIQEYLKIIKNLDNKEKINNYVIMIENIIEKLLLKYGWFLK